MSGTKNLAMKRRNIVLTGESARWLSSIRERFSTEVGFKLSYSQTMEVLSQRLDSDKSPVKLPPRSTVKAAS